MDRTKHFFAPLRVKLAGAFVVVVFIVAAMADILVGDYVFSLVSFEPQSISVNTAVYQPPGFVEREGTLTKTHWMGTDKFGRDVSSRLIYGARSALGIGIFATLISFVLALVLAILAGFYGNRRFTMSWYQLGWLLFSGYVAFFYSGQLARYVNVNGEFAFSYLRFLGILIVLFILIVAVFRSFERLGGRSFYIPLDSIVIKILEIFKSIPGLFLLLSVFALVRTPTMWSVIVIIGFLRWPGLTRLLRAEIIKERSETYSLAGRTLGLTDIKLLFNHILPNAMAPVVVALAFSISNAVLLESTLSFLEIGLPLNTPSWGELLNQARAYFPAWWLALFPGLLIFLTVLSFNTLGSRLNELSNKEQ